MFLNSAHDAAGSEKEEAESLGQRDAIRPRKATAE